MPEADCQRNDLQRNSRKRFETQRNGGHRGRGRRNVCRSNSVAAKRPWKKGDRHLDVWQLVEGLLDVLGISPSSVRRSQFVFLSHDQRDPIDVVVLISLSLCPLCLCVSKIFSSQNALNLHSTHGFRSLAILTAYEIDRQRPVTESQDVQAARRESDKNASFTDESHEDVQKEHLRNAPFLPIQTTKMSKMLMFFEKRKIA